jgi:CheY-like chemotaxis protein
MKKRGASILVVDDEREIVRSLQRSLNAHGYTVFTDEIATKESHEAVEQS